MRSRLTDSPLPSPHGRGGVPHPASRSNADRYDFIARGVPQNHVRSSPQMIHAALVGYGWWGRTIASRCRASSEIAIAMVVEPGEASRAAATEAGYRTAASLDEALAAPGIDAVILATPHSLHEAQVTAAA